MPGCPKPCLASLLRNSRRVLISSKIRSGTLRRAAPRPPETHPRFIASSSSARSMTFRRSQQKFGEAAATKGTGQELMRRSGIWTSSVLAAQTGVPVALDALKEWSAWAGQYPGRGPRSGCLDHRQRRFRCLPTVAGHARLLVLGNRVFRAVHLLRHVGARGDPVHTAAHSGVPEDTNFLIRCPSPEHHSSRPSTIGYRHGPRTRFSSGPGPWPSTCFS